MLGPASSGLLVGLYARVPLDTMLLTPCMTAAFPCSLMAAAEMSPLMRVAWAARRSCLARSSPWYRSRDLRYAVSPARVAIVLIAVGSVAAPPLAAATACAPEPVYFPI